MWITWWELVKPWRNQMIVEAGLAFTAEKTWGWVWVYGECLLDILTVFASIFYFFLSLYIIFLWYIYLVTFAHTPYFVCVKAFMKYMLLTTSSLFFRHTPSHRTFISGVLCMNLAGGHKSVEIVWNFFCVKTVFCTCVVFFWVYSAKSHQSFQSWWKSPCSLRHNHK